MEDYSLTENCNRNATCKHEWATIILAVILSPTALSQSAGLTMLSGLGLGEDDNPEEDDLERLAWLIDGLGKASVYPCGRE